MPDFHTQSTSTDISLLIKDMFIILFSSCTQRMPDRVTELFAGRRGYHRVGTNDNHSGGRNNDPEAENRLIDQLDEEWED